MRIGVCVFVTDYSMAIVKLARALEERGFASLFVPEHTHIPASRRSGRVDGSELPRQYSHMLDPFVSLAAAAAATTRLRLGTGICLLTERDPIVTAKAVASLDLISNGRFEFGIGAGWNAGEMANHSTVFETRFHLMAHRAKAMKAIWTNDEASYEGEFTKFERIWSWPKPVRSRTRRSCWAATPDTRCAGSWILATVGSRSAKGGSIRRSACNGCARPPKKWDATSGWYPATLFGAEAEAGYLERCRAAGMDRVLFALPSEGRAIVLPLLDKFAAFVG